MLAPTTTVIYHRCYRCAGSVEAAEAEILRELRDEAEAIPGYVLVGVTFNEHQARTRVDGCRKCGGGVYEIEVSVKADHAWDSNGGE